LDGSLFPANIPAVNVAGSPQKTTVQSIAQMKGRARVAALTAYDFPGAKLLDEAGVPFVLVGDSLGMVALGHPDTTHVTMDDMLHHTRAVVRAKPSALVGTDLPYRSYDSPRQAVANARRLVEAGAEFVKAEGGREILPQVEAILAAGIAWNDAASGYSAGTVLAAETRNVCLWVMPGCSVGFISDRGRPSAGRSRRRTWRY
jgi:2-methylisocitrate lyase-like PEP mutase family enzyme